MAMSLAGGTAGANVHVAIIDACYSIIYKDNNFTVVDTGKLKTKYLTSKVCFLGKAGALCNWFLHP